VAAHRYWRVYCVANAGDGSYTGVTEIEMATSAAGADATSTTFAIGSGTYQAGTAATAFNNDFTGDVLQWSGAGAGVWVGQDFGSGNSQDIVEVRIRPNKDLASRTFGHFNIQYSDDGATWTTAWVVSYVGWTVGTTFTLSKPTAASAWRYWRLVMANSLNNIFAIAKMTLATALGGADQTGSGTPIESSNYPSYVAANAFDGSSSTFWNSNSAANYEYLGYDFGAGVTKAIIEIGLLPRQNGTFSTQWPQTIDVQGSSDGVSWLSQWVVPATLNSYSDGAWVFRNPSALSGGSTHRFWGIRPTALQSGPIFGVADVEFRATVGGADNTSGGIGLSRLPYDGSALPHAPWDNAGGAEYSSTTAGLSDLIAYDYGAGNEKSAPAQIAITARVTGGTSNFNQAPTAFDLVYSDDGFTFTTAQSLTTPATWTSLQQRLFLGAAVGSRRRQLIGS
jgi:hypothetical protein